MAFKTALNVFNVLTFLLILYGVAQRRNRSRHVRIMTTCFVLDLLMVLVIEITRGAIKQAVTATRPLMHIHIAVSVAALVLWVGQIVTGRAVIAGKPRRGVHRIQAAAFVLVRATNVVTAFMVSHPA